MMIDNYKQKYSEIIENALQDYNPNYIEYIKDRYKDRKICIWGAGNMGVIWPDILEKCGLEVSLYVDNNPQKHGNNCFGIGIPCVGVEDLRPIKDDVVILIPTRYYKEIRKQLDTMGFPIVDRIFMQKIPMDVYLKNENRDTIIRCLARVIDLLEDEISCNILTKLVLNWTLNKYIENYFDDIYTTPQYFPRDIVNSRNDEVFVDCGAYIGDNVDDFIDFSDRSFKRYYAFELNRTNCERLATNIKERWKEYEDKFVIENSGVGEKKGRFFYSDDCESSKIGQGGEYEGYITDLDSYFEKCEEKPTFIKMDIEGSELSALKGAKRLITENMPTLAICIYHKEEDYWKIPLYIKENWPNYKLYIRHHTDLTNETVCYAIYN